MKKTILLSCLFCFATMLPAQNATTQIVSGTIVGYDGEALVGASVSVVGKSIGTISDINGKFRIAVAGEDVLHVAYLGYQTVELYPEEIEYELKGRVELKEGMWLKEVVITASKSDYSSTSTCFGIIDIWYHCPEKSMNVNIANNAPKVAEERLWQYYPNPATDCVTVVTQEANGFINVFSSDGKLVARQSVTDVQTRVNMMGLSAGMYFLSYENEGGVQAVGKVSLVRP